MAFSESVARLGIGTPYDDLIRGLVSNERDRIALVKGVISQESRWEPTAVREEPAIRRLSGGQVDASYGLMQVLLSTARSVSQRPALTAEELLEPMMNIGIGTGFLLDQLTRYLGNEAQAVAAYNAGSARQNAAGQYVNSKGDPSVQAYVDSVLAYQVWYINHDPMLTDATPPDETLPSNLGGCAPMAIAVAGAVVAFVLLFWMTIAHAQGTAGTMITIPDFSCPINTALVPALIRSANSSRMSLTCANTDAVNSIRVGDVNTTPTRGLRVGPGQPFKHSDPPAIYCQSEAAAVRIACTETTK